MTLPKEKMKAHTNKKSRHQLVKTQYTNKTTKSVKKLATIFTRTEILAAGWLAFNCIFHTDMLHSA